MATPDNEALREELLQDLYDLVESSDRSRKVTWLDYAEWAIKKGYEAGAVNRAQEWLVDRGFAEHPAMGPLLALLPGGQDAIEKLHRDRAEEASKPDDGDASSATAFLTVAEARQLEPFIGKVREALEEHAGALSADDEEDLRAQIETIEAQQRSPRPRRGVVEGAVAAIRLVAMEAAKGSIGAGAFLAIQTMAQNIFSA